MRLLIFLLILFLVLFSSPSVCSNCFCNSLCHDSPGSWSTKSTSDARTISSEELVVSFPRFPDRVAAWL